VWLRDANENALDATKNAHEANVIVHDAMKNARKLEVSMRSRLF
jgi:hypothetical protein